MTYLSLIPAHELLTGMGDPHRMHADVMSLFPSLDAPNPRQHAGVLFRVEQPADRAAHVLIRSGIEPVQRAGLLTRQEQCAPPEGLLVKFQLAVNAVTRSTANGVRPVPADSDEEDTDHTLSGWLERRLGNTLTGVQVIRHTRTVNKGRARTSKRLTVQVDDVFGIAHVGDTTALGRLMADGVGRAKAYGCGLLTLKALG